MSDDQVPAAEQVGAGGAPPAVGPATQGVEAIGGPPPATGPFPAAPGPTVASGPAAGVESGAATGPAGRRSRRRRKSRLHAAIGFVTDRGIPLLIAVLGLLAALAGTWGVTATADNKDLEDAKSSLEDRSDRLSEENEALAADLDQVTEDRDRWKERAQQPDEPDEPDTGVGDGLNGPDDPDESTTATTTPRPGRTSTVLRQTGSTPVTFADDYGIDLDTDAPDWGVNTSAGDLVLHYASSSGTNLGTYEMSLVDHVPTEAECDDATVLQSRLAIDQTREGVQMCVRTSEDRFAYVHIVAIDYEAQTITLDLIVWE